MTEWHVTPDYIMCHWTDELFNLMVVKLAERKTREREAIEGKPKVSQDGSALKRMGSMVKVVKKDGD